MTLFLIGCLTACNAALSGRTDLPQAQEKPSDQPVRIATTPLGVSDFERLDLTFGSAQYAAYLRRGRNGAPLLVMIQGSGCEPVFSNLGDGRYSGTAGQDVVASLSGERHHVLIVEKPHAGQSDGGEQGDCSEAFRRQHSLENWTHTVDLVSSAVHDELQALAGIRVIGLSEGAIVAAHLAASQTAVSHVAFISGHGCHQLDDMLVRARRDWLLENQDAGTDAKQEGVAETLRQSESDLRRIFASPEDSTTNIWGQTPLFWSTFGMACPATDLAASDADVFIAYGTQDEQITADGLEEIVTRRIVAGKDVTTHRVVGGSHVLSVEGDENPYARLIETFRLALDWMDPKPL
ncbi:alpha/beta fold hydrolase [uncultured Algimonas sp.]|uniref:alpha/beta fold hydrolase n=1 Tax=uncultured Algimonas sp. TaxID=1547920 RepID=UPI002610EC7B|nr:alpha/beta fold hydrolase [uncultured Algimonas sp.]